jgi:hypothetical protein
LYPTSTGSSVTGVVAPLCQRGAEIPVWPGFPSSWAAGTTGSLPLVARAASPVAFGGRPGSADAGPAAAGGSTLTGGEARAGRAVACACTDPANGITTVSANAARHDLLMGALLPAAC